MTTKMLNEKLITNSKYSNMLIIVEMFHLLAVILVFLSGNKKQEVLLLLVFTKYLIVSNSVYLFVNNALRSCFSFSTSASKTS